MAEYTSFFTATAKCIAATDKAILVEITDLDQAWLPLSQIDDRSEVWKAGDEGKLIISSWIAEQKGWL